MLAVVVGLAGEAELERDYAVGLLLAYGTFLLGAGEAAFAPAPAVGKPAFGPGAALAPGTSRAGPSPPVSPRGSSGMNAREPLDPGPWAAGAIWGAKSGAGRPSRTSCVRA